MYIITTVGSTYNLDLIESSSLFISKLLRLIISYVDKKFYRKIQGKK